ncbi:MAG: ATP-binding cassette domain-containing protein [Planctomycetota bacterium]|nr:ATP-binding cassette domain-containing protein [Planctomycetota bacterium]
MALLQLQDLTVSFGGPPILDGIDLTIEPGEHLALLGRNGAGKSTLMRVIMGTQEPDEGRIIGRSSCRVAYLDQQVPHDLTGTILDVVMSAPGVAEHAAKAAISRIGLDPWDWVPDVSAGMKRRTLLARALATEPDLLLLDEPTNHLDIEAIAWLEDFLLRRRRALLVVTHDRAFLRRVATGILDLDRGHITRFGPDYDQYVARKSGSLAAEARGDKQFDKKLAQEEAWARKGVRGRRKRNMGRVNELEEMRTTRSERRDVAGSVKIEAQSSAPSGRIVLRAKDVSFAWPDGPSIEGLTTEIQRGDRVGIIGPNGTGKTTLLRLLLGEIEPTSGTVQQGTNVDIAYFDQLHAHLDESLSAADNVGEGSSTVLVNGKERQVISYLRDFLFDADQARGSITSFSGGERNRLLLAKLFVKPSNLLVLDEPTNDLDVETLEVLEGLLAEYEGTILVVSHDRELLDHVVTSTLVLEGEGRVGDYVGGYSDWLTQRKVPGDAAKGKSKKT